jgi:hypothetical protein
MEAREILRLNIITIFSSKYLRTISAVPNRATPRPSKLRRTSMSYAAPPLSSAAPQTATPHPNYRIAQAFAPALRRGGGFGLKTFHLLINYSPFLLLNRVK